MQSGSDLDIIWLTIMVDHTADQNRLYRINTGVQVIKLKLKQESQCNSILVCANNSTILRFREQDSSKFSFVILGSLNKGFYDLDVKMNEVVIITPSRLCHQSDDEQKNLKLKNYNFGQILGPSWLVFIVAMHRDNPVPLIRFLLL